MTSSALTDEDFEAIVAACDGDPHEAICAIESDPWPQWLREIVGEQ